VSRILRLAVLAPDLVEAILGGSSDRRVILKKLERPLPVGWEEQRAILARGQHDLATSRGVYSPVPSW
jgi:hypothetical protein